MAAEPPLVPEPASVGVRVTLTGVDDVTQPVLAFADSGVVVVPTVSVAVVVGAWVSMLT